MLRKWFSYGGMLLLAGAAILATPGSGLAHGGGGGHFGGAHFGGAHFGGYHYGYPRAYYGYHHYHYPYYGYSSYYPPYYDSYGYLGPGTGYELRYYGGSGDEAPYYSNGYEAYSSPATGTDQPDNIAHVTVNVPADALVWFDDTLTTSTGSGREYQSPPLTPDHQYTYEVRARWDENGHEVTQTQKVKVTAGAHVRVTFPVPAKTAAQAAAAKKG
jgi:uncharacterized protein (TIGR03000 family)